MPKQATPKKGAAAAAAPKTQPDPRTAKIEAIAAKRQAGYKASTEEAIAAGLTSKEPIEEETVEDPTDVVPESQEDNDTGSHQDAGQVTDDPPDSTEAVGDDNNEPTETELPEALRDQLVLENGKVKVKLKVDGRLQLVELESLTSDAQKLAAGDARLREAANARNELNRREQELNDREAKLKTREQPPAPAGADDKELDAEAAEFGNLVLTGTKEEIAAATKKLLQKTRSSAAPPVDEDAIVRKTRAQLAQEAYDASLVRGYDRFQKEFKDVFEDDDLRAAADARTDRIANANPDWTPEQVILEAAKQIREKEEAKVAAVRTGKQPAPKPLANRGERKQNLRPIPAQRNAKNEPPKPQAPQTNAQYVAQLKKARGQG